jgi:hypothetical protein
MCANVLKAKVWIRLVRLKNKRILAILKVPQNSVA